MSDGGKGSTQRPESQPGAYAEGYERIFGKDAKPAKEGGTPKDDPWPEQ